MTLRYKWITLATFMVPDLEPVFPSGRLSQKMYTYNLDRPPWLVTKKTHGPLCIIIKKREFYDSCVTTTEADGSKGFFRIARLKRYG